MGWGGEDGWGANQNRRKIQKGIWGQKSGGDFFIKKELNTT